MSNNALDPQINKTQKQITNLQIKGSRSKVFTGVGIALGAISIVGGLFLPAALGKITFIGLGALFAGKSFLSGGMKQNDIARSISMKQEELDILRTQTDELASVSARPVTPVAHFQTTPVQPTYQNQAQTALEQYMTANQVLQNQQEDLARRVEQILEEENARQTSAPEVASTPLERYATNLEGIPIMSLESYQQMQEEMGRQR